MLSLDQPLTRGRYVSWGTALVALKTLADYAVARAFSTPFSLSFYVVPLLDTPQATGWNGAPHAASGYWLAVVGCALPFVAAGLALTLRRLRDAGLPPLLALLFFVPMAKFVFFAALAAAPSRGDARIVTHGAGPYRRGTTDLGPEEPAGARRRRLRAFAAGALAGDTVAMLAMGISVGLLRDYGWPLMIATPAVAGFVASHVYCRMCRATAGGVVLVTLTTFAAGMAFLGAAALEGFGCILMLAPLFVGEALLGALLAYAFARSSAVSPFASMASSVVILPIAFATNGASPPPPEVSLPIESVVIVRAPPDVVWKRVIAFPPLAPPTEPLFRAGIAAPLAATIEGEGPGAIRRCEVTTGTFVEPIDVWKPGRELSFTVSSQPDPMRELTLHAGPRPPHLDGYLQSTRGQFVLEPLADGSTRLVGRTWYRVHMQPEGYWRLWGDAIIHAIHIRVPRHVAGLAEADARESP